MSTAGQLAKINAQRSVWSQWLSRERKVLLLLDEAELFSAELVASLCWPFDGMVGAGDSRQKEWHANRSAATSEMKDSRQRISALQFERASDWVKRNPRSSHHESAETWRFGSTIVQALQRLFPQELQSLSSPGMDASGRDTHLLPIIFEDLRWCGDWDFAHSEILRSSTLFASLAVAIAVEVVYGARTSERNSITVLWTLKQPLLQLHAFLTWAIPLLCVNFQTSVQIETHDFDRSYYEKVLATALTCRAAQGAHGTDSDVCFYGVTASTQEGPSWQGDSTHYHLICEQMARAKKTVCLHRGPILRHRVPIA